MRPMNCTARSRAGSIGADKPEVGSARACEQIAASLNSRRRDRLASNTINRERLIGDKQSCGYRLTVYGCDGSVLLGAVRIQHRKKATEIEGNMFGGTVGLII